jgi:ribulose-5-phosphate 4-epimerase/fuculose-1-phosphate aldolase
MDENTLRREVATCCHMAVHLDLIDFSGHISARIPGTDTFLINSLRDSRASIRSQDIIKANFKGESMEEGKKLPGEVYIHTSIYRHRPDVMSVAHLHSPSAKILSVTGKDYLPVINHGAIFADGVPIYDDCRHINSPGRGKLMALALGQKRALIFRGHGSVVVAENIKALFAASVHFEENAKNLIEAHRIGEPIRLKEDEIIEGKRAWNPNRFEKVWSFYLDKTNLRKNG